ncbi:MAG: hypothetical protein KDB74_13680 [Flavobacteriales bacterium]|nr:hypothetical protein [Flavobacteriales bacterium]
MEGIYMNEKPVSNSEVDQFIKEFLNSDFNNPPLNYSEMKNLYFEKFRILTTPTIFLEKEIRQSLSIFRARPASKFENRDHFDYTKFGAPKNSIELGFGRCNWKGQAVFYGSDNALSSIQEAKEEYKDGNEFYVGEWEFLEHELNNPIASSILLSEKIPNGNPWKVFSKKLDEFYENSKIQELQTNKYLNKRLADMFVEANEKQYKATAFIADYFLFQMNVQRPKEIICPLLIYPGIKSKLFSMNFAIHPDFAREYMNLTRIYKIRITEKKSESARIELLMLGIVDNDKKIDYYEVQPNLDNLLQRLEYVKCECGKKYSFVELSNIEIIKQGTVITRAALIHWFIDQNENELTDFENYIPFPKTEMRVGLELSFNKTIEGITIRDGETEHSNLSMKMKVVVPIKYVPNLQTVY